MDVDEPKRLRQREIEELQLEMLRRERNNHSDGLAREAEESQKNFILLIVIIAFTIISYFFIFFIKRPKTFLILLIIGYGSLQFFAPVQGAEFNRGAVALFSRL